MFVNPINSQSPTLNEYDNYGSASRMQLLGKPTLPSGQFEFNTALAFADCRRGLPQSKHHDINRLGQGNRFFDSRGLILAEEGIEEFRPWKVGIRDLTSFGVLDANVIRGWSSVSAGRLPTPLRDPVEMLVNIRDAILPNSLTPLRRRKIVLQDSLVAV